MSNEAKSLSTEDRDPVCGMSVRIPSGQIDEKEATAKSEYNGTTYYFCSPSCKAAFDKEPSKYAKPKEGMEHGHHH